MHWDLAPSHLGLGNNRSVLPLASLNLHNRSRKIQHIDDVLDGLDEAEADRLESSRDSLTIWRGM